MKETGITSCDCGTIICYAKDSDINDRAKWKQTYDLTVKCRFCGVLATAENLTNKQIDALLKGPATPCPGDPGSLSMPHMENVFKWSEHFEILEREVHTTTRSEDN